MILVTGGAGFIGSHTCVELLKSGFNLVVIDNLSNAPASNIERVEQISGQAVHFVNADIRHKAELQLVFELYAIEAVIHFAGLKSPVKSLQLPADYYCNNVVGTLNLLAVMAEHGCKRLIFSSSASVYASSAVAVSEQSELAPATPYSRSKYMVEQVLQDVYQADPQWHIAILRYFNPVGAHPSGLLGENPCGVASNLMPCLLRVATGQQQQLLVFGDDYATPDGSGIRDYIHVMDLAAAHVAALYKLVNAVQVFNIGTGVGHSVFKLIECFESVTQQKIAYQVVGRRPNDLAFSLADPSLANQRLKWRATLTLADMCADSWRWQLNHQRLLN
jgi:UDP-glucose 4-epimerase